MFAHQRTATVNGQIQTPMALPLANLPHKVPSPHLDKYYKSSKKNETNIAQAKIFAWERMQHDDAKYGLGAKGPVQKTEQPHHSPGTPTTHHGQILGEMT